MDSVCFCFILVISVIWQVFPKKLAKLVKLTLWKQKILQICFCEKKWLIVSLKKHCPVGLGSWSNSSPILWCLSKATTDDGSSGEGIKEIWQSPTLIMSTKHEDRSKRGFRECCRLSFVVMGPRVRNFPYVVEFHIHVQWNPTYLPFGSQVETWESVLANHLDSCLFSWAKRITKTHGFSRITKKHTRFLS